MDKAMEIAFQVGYIQTFLEDNGEDGLANYMMNSFAWCDMADANPDLSADEIASLACDGFKMK